MLKTGLILGLVVPLFFGAKVMAPNNDIDASPVPTSPPPLPPMPVLPGLDPAPMTATVAADEIPWPELPQMMTPEAAVTEFLAEMIEFSGGESVRFSRLAWSYEDMRRGRAKSDDCAGYAARPWPALKDKALSTLLCSLGCGREQRDMRASGDGRPTFILIPTGSDVVDDEVQDMIEPMLLAA